MQDAEDARQDALLGAWKGLAGFEGRSSVRSWLYRIATNACIGLSAQRPRRLLSSERGPACTSVHDLGEPTAAPLWLEPYPDTDPAANYERRETVELGFVAAVQHLPATQRSALIPRDVLGFPAAEVADVLDTTVASVNSALQRARESVGRRVVPVSQQATRRALGETASGSSSKAFVGAWERADVDALAALLAEDARFAMPPLPARFAGRDAIAAFLSERAFASPWRLAPITANGQLAFAAYQGPELRLSAMLTLRGAGDRRDHRLPRSRRPQIL